MNKWISLLLLLLSVSLGLNLYLLFISPQQVPFKQVHNNNPSNNTKKNEEMASTIPTRLFSDEDKNEKPPQPTAIYSSPQTQSKVKQTSQTATSRANSLAQATMWLKEKNLLTLGSFLQDYLKQFPQDMDFLLLEAKFKVQTTLLSDAITHYYDLLRNPMTAIQQNEIESQIERLSTNTIEQLKRNYSWDILATFVEPLLQLEPNNRVYILSLATAYAELYQEGLMENVLAALPFNDPEIEKIRRIILAQQEQTDDNTDNEKVNNIAHQGQPVLLKQFGDQYVVEAKLSSNQVSLLIDTGASVTAISKQYFENLSNRYKVNYLGSFDIGTAGGRIMARMYQFSELTINHVTVQNLPVVILPLHGIENADGLLGMNFLREFDFKIDQQQSVMFIK